MHTAAVRRLRGVRAPRVTARLDRSREALPYTSGQRSKRRTVVILAGRSHEPVTRFARAFERVRRAAGSRSAWITPLDAVRATEGAGETVLARIEALAQAIGGWNTAADLAILDAFDVSARTVTELRAAARAAGTSTLQYAVTDAPIRGLGLRRNKSPSAPTA